MTRLGSSASSIDIAVAWATVGPALDELCRLVDWRHIRLRALIGVDFNQTSPDALERLRRSGVVRIGASATGVFHPKLYLFHGAPPHAIVGSANLTNAAFSGNTEIALEKSLDSDEYQEVREFFEEQWRTSRPFTDECAAEYRQRWMTMQRELGVDCRGSRAANASQQVPAPGLEALVARLRTWSWSEYRAAMVDVETIRVAEGNSLLCADRNSWIHTVRLASPLARSRLHELERGERGIVFGIGIPTLPPGVNPGYFGNLEPRGDVKSIATGQQGVPMTQFQQDSLRYISDALDQLGDGPLDLGLIGRVFDALNQVHGFGIAAISRLMTLRRPDSMMIVNGANARLMSSAFGIAENRLKARNGYLEAHDVLWNTPWWCSAQPAGFADTEFWRFRSALVDAFVYEGRSS